MSGDCPLCKAPNRRYYEKQLTLGALSAHDVGEQLKADPKIVWTHMRNHISDKYATVEDRIQLLENMYDRVQERLEGLMTKDIDPRVERAIKDYIRELSQLAQDIQKLKGKNMPDHMILIQQNQAQLERFQSYMLEHACEDCKVEFRKFLEKEKPETVVMKM